MDAETRAQVHEAHEAVTQALEGLITFLATLRPTLRNEIMQICGQHIEKARLAKERLATILAAGQQREG